MKIAREVDPDNAAVATALAQTNKHLKAIARKERKIYTEGFKKVAAEAERPEDIEAEKKRKTEEKKQKHEQLELLLKDTEYLENVIMQKCQENG